MSTVVKKILIHLEKHQTKYNSVESVLEGFFLARIGLFQHLTFQHLNFTLLHVTQEAVRLAKEIVIKVAKSAIKSRIYGLLQRERDRVMSASQEESYDTFLAEGMTSLRTETGCFEDISVGL